jgi:hypothetical protein
LKTPTGRQKAGIKQNKPSEPRRSFSGAFFFGIFLKTGQENSYFFDFTIQQLIKTVFLGFVKDKG